MQPHPEQVDPPPDRSRRRLLAVAILAVGLMVIVLLHLLGVVHG